MYKANQVSVKLANLQTDLLKNDQKVSYIQGISHLCPFTRAKVC